jgi:MFS superfamily sulfate permease-like transporter
MIDILLSILLGMILGIGILILVVIIVNLINYNKNKIRYFHYRINTFKMFRFFIYALILIFGSLYLL